MRRCAICHTPFEANPYEPPEDCDCGANAREPEGPRRERDE